MEGKTRGGEGGRLSECNIKEKNFFKKKPIVNIGMWGEIISQKLAIE